MSLLRHYIKSTSSHIKYHTIIHHVKSTQDLFAAMFYNKYHSLDFILQVYMSYLQQSFAANITLNTHMTKK